MAQSIKISDDEMDMVRAAADLNSRSIAGQVTHWMRIGRSIKQAPEFTYAHIRDALEGNRSPDGLTGEEQAVYIDQLLAELSEETPEQAAFFAKRRSDGLGVGLNADGLICRQEAPEGK